MYIALDLETTGLDPNKDKIIQIGFIVFNENGKIFEKYETYINTNKEIPEIISEITGIKNEDIKNAPKFEKIKSKIQNLLNENTLVGHNIDFDISFLIKEGITIKKTYIDTLFLSSAIFSNEKSHSLENLCKNFKIKQKKAHTALEDSISAMKLFLILKKSYENLNNTLVKEIKKISKKGNIQEIEFFKNLKGKDKKRKELKKNKKTLKGKEKFQLKLKHIYETNLAYSEIVEDLLKKKKVCISVSNEVFDQIYNYKNVRKIQNNEKYIDLKKLKSIHSKKMLSISEAKALIKILLWQKNSENEDMNSIKLFNEEKFILNKISKNKTIEIKELNTSKKTLISHELLIQENFFAKEIYIIDLNALEKAIVQKETKSMNLEKFINLIEEIKLLNSKTVDNLIKKSTIIFGIIGIFFEKTSKKDSRFLELNDSNINDKNIKKIQLAINNLQIVSKEIIEKTTNKSIEELKILEKNIIFLKDFFYKNNFIENQYTIIKNYDDSIVLKKKRKNLSQIKREILKKFEKISIIDKAITLNDEGLFFRNYYELNKDLTLLKEKPLKIKPKLLSAEETDFAKKIENLNKSNDRTIIVSNNKRLTKKLTIELKKLNPKKTILSEASSSLGKIKENINQKGITLIISINNLEKLVNIKKIDKVFFCKIPFIYIENRNERNLDQKIPQTLLRIKRVSKTCLKIKDIFILDDQKNIELLEKEIKRSFKDYFKTF